MDFISVLSAILVLFLLIGVGFGARKQGILNTDRVHGISHLLVNIVLPALTISSMQVPLSEQTIGIVNNTLYFAVGYYFATFGLSLVITRFLPSSDTEKGVFQFMLIFPNVGFMGIPVAQAILGPGSLFDVILFNLPFNFLVFTMGMYLLARGKPGKMDPRLLLTPGLAASVVGLSLFLAGYTQPLPVGTALDWIGKATTPLANAGRRCSPRNSSGIASRRGLVDHGHHWVPAYDLPGACVCPARAGHP